MLPQRMRSIALASSIFLGALALTHYSPAAAQQRPAAFDIDVSGWIGGAVADEQAGRFNFCGASRVYPGGFTVSLALNPEGFLNIGYGRPSFGLTTGTETSAQLSIDGGTDRALAAIAVNDEQWVIQTGRDDELREQLKRGNELTIVLGGQTTYRVPLTGTFRSINALEECINVAVQGIVAARRQQSLITGEQLGGLLAEAGLTGAEIADAREVSPDNPLGIAYLWRLPESGVFGALHQSPRTAEVQMRGFLNAFTGIVQGGCDGEFINEIDEPELFGGNYAFGEAVLTCVTEAMRSSVYIFAVLDDANYTLFYHEGSDALAEAARDATNALAASIRASTQ